MKNLIKILVVTIYSKHLYLILVYLNIMYIYFSYSIFDFIFFIGIIILFPLLILIIGWFENGSPLFTQPRIGKNQKKFICKI